jgi:hypothetical protein
MMARDGGGAPSRLVLGSFGRRRRSRCGDHHRDEEVAVLDAPVQAWVLGLLVGGFAPGSGFLGCSSPMSFGVPVQSYDRIAVGAIVELKPIATS